MKKRLILFSAILSSILVFMGSISTNAVGVQDWVYQDKEDHTTGESIEGTKDGGYLVSGTTARMLYLKKFSSDGKLLWNKIHPEALAGFDVKETTDGGFIVVGQTRHADDPKNGVQSIVIKTNSEGDMEWHKILGGVGFDKHSTVILMKNGYLIGGTQTKGNREAAGILYIDHSGKVIWNKVMDQLNGKYPSFVEDLMIVNDNTILALLYYTDAKSFSNTALVEVSLKGDVKWKASDQGEAFSIEQGPSRGYVLALRNNMRQLQVVRMNRDFKTIWSKIYIPGFSKFYDDGSPYQIKATKDGGYLIAGTAEAVNSQIAYVFKIDSKGKRLWEKTFLKAQSHIKDIHINQDGTFVITGSYSEKISKDNYLSSMFVIKGK
ncbi:hypothetical protein [Pseudoneobacillus sp. C159]